MKKPPVPDLTPRAKRPQARQPLRKQGRAFPTLATTAGLLAVICALAYGNSFRAELLLDNQPIILQDPRLRTFEWQSLRNIFTFNYWWPTFESDLFRPFTTLTYAINFSALGSGPRPFGYHLVNLLLHWANTVLAFSLVRQVSGRPFVALFAAAVLATHPLTVESVTNIVGRADLLAGVSILGGLLLYRRYLAAEGRGKLPWLAGLGGAFLAGLFSKESAAVLPGLLLLHDVAFAGAGAPARWTAIRRRLARAWPAYVTVASGLAILLWARWAVLSHSPIAGQNGADNPIAMAGLWTGLMTAVKVLGYDLALFAWPARLTCDYSFNQITLFGWTLASGQDLHAWLALVALLALFAWAVISWRRQPAVFFFLGFAAGTILPTANLLFPIGTIMAERFMYLPVLGLAVTAVLSLTTMVEKRIAARPEKRREWFRTATVVAAVLVAALAARTIARNEDWTSSQGLWSSAVRAAPGSYRVHMALASTVMESDPSGGRADEALRLASPALQIIEQGQLPLHHTPVALYLEVGWYHLRKGQMLGARGDAGAAGAALAEAVSALRRAETIDREINRRARETLLARGWEPAAIHDIGNATIYRNLGTAHLLAGQPHEAVGALSYMQRIRPRDDDAHYARGLAEAAAGQREEDSGNSQQADEHMERAAVNLIVATLLNPGSELAWNVLAKVYDRFQVSPAAILGAGASRQVNTGHPLVLRHFRQACAQLVQQLSDAGLREDAAAWRDRLIHEYRMPPDVFTVPPGARPPA